MRRVRRRALLVAVAWLVASAAQPARGDRARLLATDREAAEARVEMVLGAEREILASAFIFGDDAFTLTSLALLRDAARRGVLVELLVDAQWNRIPRPVLAHLLAEGIAIREFHPFRFDRLGWILRRMHDKLLVVDGRELVAGGRNVESPYYGFGRQLRRRNYLDLDLQVVGAVAGEAREYFRRVWASRHVRPVRIGGGVQETASAARELDGHMRWLEGRIEEAREDPRRESPRLAEVGSVRFLHDPIGERGSRGVGGQLRDLLGEARESALVESPYLIPSRALRASLLDAVRRGVRVRILTNSLSTTDNLWAQAGYVGHRRELVESGIDVWEYAGPESMHAKAAVFDRRIAVVGSYNLDPRSERLNSELALVVDDRALAAELLALFDRHLDSAWRLDERGWPEGSDRPFPGVLRGRVCRLHLTRLLVPLLRGQL